MHNFKSADAVLEKKANKTAEREFAEMMNDIIEHADEFFRMGEFKSKRKLSNGYTVQLRIAEQGFATNRRRAKIDPDGIFASRSKRKKV